MKKIYSEYESFQWEKKNTSFLVLDKDEVNCACFSPDIVGYDIIQIEPGNKNEYIVEIVKRGNKK